MSQLQEWYSKAIYTHSVKKSKRKPRTFRKRSMKKKIVPLPAPLEYYKYNETITPELNSEIIAVDPVAKDVAMRKGLMYGARKLLPRAVPYVGWGLLAKDIYDFFND